jgi:hypothetical protein
VCMRRGVARPVRASLENRLVPSLVLTTIVPEPPVTVRVGAPSRTTLQPSGRERMGRNYPHLTAGRTRNAVRGPTIHLPVKPGHPADAPPHGQPAQVFEPSVPGAEGGRTASLCIATTKYIATTLWEALHHQTGNRCTSGEGTSAPARGNLCTSTWESLHHPEPA